MSTDEVWSVDIGDEGWQLNHESGRTWGLNKNYGHPEDLAKFLNADHRKAAQADALAAALTNISDEIMAGGGDPITLRIMAREAQVLLASYASNPAEAEPSEEKRG